LEAQRDRIETWARQNEHTIIADFEDAGISGKNVTDRPAIQQAVSLACRNRDSCLVITSLSRLARSTRDALEISERLTKAGASLTSIGDNISSAGPVGRFFFTILNAVNELERAVSNERTSQVLHFMRTKRVRISGRLPFGWSLGEDGSHLNPHPAEQAVLADMQQMRAAGTSYREIARILTERGVPTKEGRAIWSYKTVIAILTRESEIAASAA
jgi:DNA invertase Pin-like site-specific DNA recombinase